MARGRPRLGGTEEERAEARRARVRLHVQAYRQRQKEKDEAHNLHPAKQGITIIYEYPGRKPHDQPELNDLTNAAGLCIRHKSTDATNKGVVALSPHGAKLPVVMNEGPAYRGSFFDALLDRYLPDATVPIGFEGMLDMFRFGIKAMPVTCSAWLITACDAATYEGAEILSESVLSMALVLIGAERNDRRISMTGLRAYQRALIRIQNGVAVVLAGNAASSEMYRGWLPLSCMACALTEFMASRSVTNFKRHLEGIALLIQQDGPKGLELRTMRALFYEHRGIYVAFSFLDRRSCFYSREGWIDFTWKAADKLASSHLQTLLDIAYLIPELMEEYDSTPPASVESLKKMMQCAHQFDMLLDRWKSDMDTSVVVPIITVKHNDSVEIFPDQISFASIGVATAMIYYWAFKIYLKHMIVDIANDLSVYGESIDYMGVEATNGALDFTSRICQSMAYCFQQNNGILGKLVGLFPFDAAWQTIIRANDMPGFDLGRELEFCQATADQFRSFGLTLFRER